MKNFIIRLREYIAAVCDCPKGIVCGWCWRPNFFFDDCGWFRCNPLAHEQYVQGARWDFGKEPKDFRCTCRSCFDGGIGKKHEAYYGQSDR